MKSQAITTLCALLIALLLAPAAQAQQPQLPRIPADLARFYKGLAAAVDAGRRASTLARALYDQGLSDYLPVLDAERSLTDLEDRLTASETGVVTRLVALYTALGGGWQVFEGESVATAEGHEWKERSLTE